MRYDIIFAGAFLIALVTTLIFVYLYVRERKTISQIYKEAKENSTSLDDSAKAARAKTEFVANMSHEIRVPMNAISCATELLCKEDLSNRAKSYINILQTSSATLLEMVNSTLDFSKMDIDKLSIVDSQYSLRDVLEDTESIISTILSSKDVYMTVDLDASLPRFMVGDEVRIKQILINLLKNSVKYTAKGTIGLKIEKAGETDGCISLKITVSDTGCGITPLEANRLRQMFESDEHLSSDYFDKYGRGLFFVNQLAKAMGGALTFTSSLGEGSEFVAVINQRTGESPEKIESFTINSQIDVLVWEDNDIYRANLVRILNNINVSVKTISKVSDVTMYLSTVKVDYIICSETHFEETVSLINRHSHSTVPIKLAEIDEAADTSFDGNFAVLKRPVDIFKVLDILKTGAYKQMHSAEHIGKLMAPDASILVVDDNKVNLKVAKALIETFSVKVTAVTSGMEAVNLIKMGEKFDLILMDHMMPDMDGIETSKKIWEFEKDKKTPIIALTANAGSEVEKLFNNAGMSDFIPKPIVVKHLNFVLQRWLPKEKQIFLESSNISGNRFLRLHSKAIQPDWGLAKVWNDEKIYLGILHVYLEKSVDIFKCMEENADDAESIVKGEELRKLAISVGASRLPEMIDEAISILKVKDIPLYRVKLSEAMEEHVKVCDEIAEYLKKEETDITSLLLG